MRLTLFFLGTILLIVFVLWMNLTPGSYGSVCKCGDASYTSTCQLVTEYVVREELLTPEGEVCPQATGLRLVQNTILTIAGLADWAK